MHIRSAGRLALRTAAGLVLFLLLGNLVIYGFSAWARSSSASPGMVLAGVRNLRVVDDRVWRGAAPTRLGYEALAAQGVSTVVDLRAEDDLEGDRRIAAALGMEVVRIPIRDGQVPSSGDVGRFLAAVHDAPGTVFVHCGAGVGRTGTMAASYLVARGEASPLGALRRNLSVGPPSLEQMSFVAGLGGGVDRPDAVITAVSRVLDAPRRIWSRL